MSNDNKNRKPDFNVCVSEKGKDGEGNDKYFYTRIGVAWKSNEGEGIHCKTAEGVALTGDFWLFPKTDRTTEA